MNIYKCDWEEITLREVKLRPHRGVNLSRKNDCLYSVIELGDQIGYNKSHGTRFRLYPVVDQMLLVLLVLSMAVDGWYYGEYHHHLCAMCPCSDT